MYLVSTLEAASVPLAPEEKVLLTPFTSIVVVERLPPSVPSLSAIPSLFSLSSTSLASCFLRRRIFFSKLTLPCMEPKSVVDQAAAIASSRSFCALCGDFPAAASSRSFSSSSIDFNSSVISSFRFLSGFTSGGIERLLPASPSFTALVWIGR